MAASQARLTPSAGLRNLLSRPRLTELLGQDEPVAWLAGDIRRNATLYAYLRREHGVQEVNPFTLLPLLGKEFLKAQPDKWILRLYGFLNGERTGRYHADLDYRLDDVPLIRLEDGRHVAVGVGREPVAFLPTDPPIEFPNTVRRAVCDSKPAREFLEWRGLSEPDRIDEIIGSVVPRYRDQQSVKRSGHADDLRNITEVFVAASRWDRERLVEAVRETYFVRAVDARTGKTSIVKPGDLYLRTNRLRPLFDGVPGVLFPARSPKGVSAADMARLLEACGAWGTLAPVPSTAVARRQLESEYLDLLG